MQNIPETIENQWDIFYRDYPEIYDRWSRIVKRPTAVEIINQHFPLVGKTILDIGSGTGLSTFELARYAHLVFGVEQKRRCERWQSDMWQNRELPTYSFWRVGPKGCQ
jgi:tRNA G46 methylase TrmB